MKNYTIYLLFIFSCNLGFSQLFVKSGSYMYVKNTVLFAKGNLQLDGTSNLYLRNEGQFVQGKTGTSTNSGDGKLSVFQEGNSDNYEYNYWCSPVGHASTATGNENFDISMLNMPTTNIASTQAATTGSYNGIASPLTIASYWIYAFRAASNYTNWYQISNMSYTNANALKAGEGFTMKGTSGQDLTNVEESATNNPYQAAGGAYPAGIPSSQRYDFRGKPNDGDINIAVLPPTVAGATTTINSTLTGNPYPSAINLNYFLLENSGRSVNYTTGVVDPVINANKVIEGTAYFWEQNKSTNSHNIASYDGGYSSYIANGTDANVQGVFNKAAYSTYNLDGSINGGSGITGIDQRRMFLAVGQGFMVNGEVSASPTKPAVMKNVYRVFKKESELDGPQFQKNSNLNNSITTDQNWDDIPNVAGVDYTQFSKLEVPQIKILSVLNNQITKEITMAFNPNTNDGFDASMEAQAMDEFSTDINFAFTGDTKNYVITTLPFAMNKRIPVTLKSAGVGTFKVKVDSYINFTETNTVYLYDNVSEVYHDIASNAYEFTLPEGTYASRFEITFQNTTLANPNNIKNNFVVVQNNNSQLLSISNPNSLEMKAVVLFDISGKQIFNKVNLGAKTIYEFPTQTLSEGVYLVKLQTNDNQTLTQKIILSKK